MSTDMTPQEVREFVASKGWQALKEDLQEFREGAVAKLVMQKATVEEIRFAQGQIDYCDWVLNLYEAVLHADAAIAKHNQEISDGTSQSAGG